VIRAGAGIDTIDVNAASDLGVFVSNCPGRNSIAVAELVMGLVLACDRRIPDQVADLRAGRWHKGEYSRARGLHGRTFGIVGLGQIGREIATRAAGFGMHVAAWSRNLTLAEAERLGLRYCQTPLEVARVSDVVSINVAANPDTAEPGERGVPGGNEAGGILDQHLARERDRRAGAGPGHPQQRRAGGPRRLPE
jgi:D-3-phosphoglycerate dehydrogenase